MAHYVLSKYTYPSSIGQLDRDPRLEIWHCGHLERRPNTRAAMCPRKLFSIELPRKNYCGMFDLNSQTLPSASRIGPSDTEDLCPLYGRKNGFLLSSSRLNHVQMMYNNQQRI